MDRIAVGITEGGVVRENQVPIFYALGSRVRIYPYDRRERIADMAHIIFPERKYSIHWDNTYKFADKGVHELMDQMKEQGARPAGLITKVTGDTRIFDASSGVLDIGQQDVVAIRGCLAQEGIRLVARHTGQNYGRTILFCMEDGGLEVDTVRRSTVVL